MFQNDDDDDRHHPLLSFIHSFIPSFIHSFIHRQLKVAFSFEWDENDDDNCCCQPLSLSSDLKRIKRKRLVSPKCREIKKKKGERKNDVDEIGN